MSQQFALQGRNALVTGATRGIGLAIAHEFLAAGATVTICGRKPEGVETALADLESYHGMVQGVTAHVGDTESVEQLVATARERFGTIDILVNNAGTNPHFGPIVESDEAAWDKTLDVNLKGPYTLSKLVARQMAEPQGGSIINIASVGGLTALENQGLYSVSKAGLIMLTKVMARELGRRNIRVNAVCPGLIKTRLSEALWSDPKLEQSITSQKALNRIGTPDEIVGAVLYFASQASSFTTGAVLQVDGGMSI